MQLFYFMRLYSPCQKCILHAKICINDIKNCTDKFDIVSYADDTTLISTIGSFTSPNTNISDNINSELENVNEWLAAQKLCLNVLKNKIHDVPYSTKKYFKIALIHQQY